MKTTKYCLLFLLAVSAGVAFSEINSPPKNGKEQIIEIDSHSGYFDGITNQVVYYGHVFVTDHDRARLWCELFTIDLPPDGGHPTNIVAETNVIVDVTDGQGGTNHITAAKAIYAYHLSNPVTNVLSSLTNVVYAVTNETITFTGDNPTLTTAKGLVTTGDPLVLDVPTQRFSGMSKTTYKMHPGSGGTNGSPFNF